MNKVKIYGAGSIGNHLAQASRRAGWQVVVVDPDKEALRRMKEEIYPKRYGTWDEGIGLFKLAEEPKGGFDVIFLGTPPHVRMNLAKEILQEEPRVLLLEKPICPPSLAGVPDFLDELKKHSTAVMVGYDHVISKGVKAAQELLEKGDLGAPQMLDVDFRQSWDAIFAAHPWLTGPHDSYLGFWEKGGGASGEHSHAANLWQHFAHFLGFGKVANVSADMQMVKTDLVDYDRACFMHLTTEKGFVGRVSQDVVTKPEKRSVWIQCEKGYLEFLLSGWQGGDLLRIGKVGQDIQEFKIQKSRPDDFFEEILHIQQILEGKIKVADSPISLERGIDTMKVIGAAHRSRQEKKVIVIS